MPTLAWIVAVVLMVPILAVAGIFLWIALDNRRAIKAAQTWPSVTGTILSSGVERRRNSHHAGSPAFAFFPAVEYRYEAAGRGHTGRRIHIGAEIAGRDEALAARIVARFPPGASVPVFYDPADPAQAVLDRSAPSNKFSWLLVGIVGGALLFVVLLMIGLEFYNGGMLRSVPR